MRHNETNQQVHVGPNRLVRRRSQKPRGTGLGRFTICALFTLAGFLLARDAGAGNITYTWHEDDGKDVVGSLVVPGSAQTNGVINFTDVISFNFSSVAIGFSFDTSTLTSEFFPISISMETAIPLPSDVTDLVASISPTPSTAEVVRVSFDQILELQSEERFDYFPANDGALSQGSGHWSISFSSVPEPSTLVLAGFGALGCFAYGAFRRGESRQRHRQRGYPARWKGKRGTSETNARPASGIFAAPKREVAIMPLGTTVAAFSIPPMQVWPRARCKRTRASRVRFLPRLDPMEDRTLLSPLTVTNNHDSGMGSLRATIAAATSGDIIDFSSKLNGQTINLTSGPLTLGVNLTIDGPGASKLTVSGDQARQVFVIGSGTTAKLSGMTIANGYAVQGGGIDNFGTLSVSQCVLLGNTAVGGSGDSTTPGAANGGGIANEVGASLTSHPKSAD